VLSGVVLLLQVECNECSRWVHATCEGIDQAQYDAMTLGTHPIWVSTRSLAVVVDECCLTVVCLCLLRHAGQ
jgi:hypothetical protein